MKKENKDIKLSEALQKISYSAAITTFNIGYKAIVICLLNGLLIKDLVPKELFKSYVVEILRGIISILSLSVFFGTISILCLTYIILKTIMFNLYYIKEK